MRLPSYYIARVSRNNVLGFNTLSMENSTNGLDKAAAIVAGLPSHPDDVLLILDWSPVDGFGIVWATGEFKYKSLLTYLSDKGVKWDGAKTVLEEAFYEELTAGSRNF